MYLLQVMKVVTDKHEDQLAKFGAFIAMGILDAGGRNVTVSLQTRTGTLYLSLCSLYLASLTYVLSSACRLCPHGGRA